MPGTARSLGVLGPPVLAAAIFSLVVDYSLAGSGGMATNLVEAIALPSLSRAYGIGVLAFTPIEMAVRQTASLWWILWLASLVAVGVLEWWRPDPLGPRSRG